MTIRFHRVLQVMPSVKVVGRNGQTIEKQYFFSGEHIGFDEDVTHEYKGHVNFSYDQVPLWARETPYDRASRKPISRAINGFLNTGFGGAVYLGVKDDGTAFGIVLTRYKMDHMVQNMEDLMSRYRPLVEPHRYSVEFLPVVQPNISDEDLIKAVTFDPSETADSHRRLRKHQLRTSTYCWCDRDLFAQCNVGCLPLQYIVKLSIAPWDSNDQRNLKAVGLMKAKPLHEDECGKVHVRRDACTTQLTTEEIQNYAKRTVESHYATIVKQLENEKAKMLELD